MSSQPLFPAGIPLPPDAPVGQKQTLTEHLGAIVGECRREFPTLEAVVLYGGYGRGEGSWIQDRDSWRPYNDYDVVAVVRKKISASRVSMLRTELATSLGISWVDLSQKTPARMRWLRPSIYNFDLRNASTTIYGSERFCRSIPSIDPSKLPLREILTLFCTRLWPFMGGLAANSMTEGVCGEDSRFFRNQMAKATLAVADVMLLMEGQYHPSYRERVNRVCANPLVSARDVGLFSWALNEKLLPTAPIMSAEEVKNTYDSVHQLFSRIMYQGLSAYFGKAIDNVRSLEQAYRQDLPTIIMRLLFPLVKKNLKFERVILSNIVQFYLFAAYEGNGKVDSQLLHNANAYLVKIDPSLGESMTWSEARHAVAKIRNSS